MELLLAYYGLSYKYAEETWGLGYRIKEEWMQFLCQCFIPWWVTPNGVTYFRMVLAGMVFHLLSHGIYWNLTVLLIAIAVVTDIVDGPLARVRHQETVWGANIDPIADAMIILVAAYLLIDTMPLMYWVIFWSEIASKLLRPLSYWMGFNAQANSWGKTKMIMQSFALIPIYFGNYLLAEKILILAFVIGIISLALQARGPIKKFIN